MSLKIGKSGNNASRALAKAHGATYTPPALADFVARHMLRAFPHTVSGSNLRVLDPALGPGQLVVSLLHALYPSDPANVEVHGYDTDVVAVNAAANRIATRFPSADLRLHDTDFLDLAFLSRRASINPDLFAQRPPIPEYDLIIANPPYVRTQVLGSAVSRPLARDWGLSGRIDLYYVFLLAIAEVLAPNGIAGVIVSNRFMTTKSGESIREALPSHFDIKGIWDLGDTKLFDAAVLPAVLILGPKTTPPASAPKFTSIYETTKDSDREAPSPLHALDRPGIVATPDGRRFRVRHGLLRGAHHAKETWRIATPATNAWLSNVAAHTWATFGSAGRVRVGVKTCADSVFIGDDWQSLPQDERPELLRPLITHRVARPFRARAQAASTMILYPHHVVAGRRCAMDLAEYPRDAAYLMRHRTALERRKYLLEAGRRWYEIWVPQDPNAWKLNKVVFRDIAADPTFWLDLDGMVVNGDCYWWVPNTANQSLLWLATAVGNSRFIADFYDNCFNNRLYAGHRRFMAQYVRQFPLPDPQRDISQSICQAAMRAYQENGEAEASHLWREIDDLVRRSFGVTD